jgi:hypothetical protein
MPRKRRKRNRTKTRAEYPDPYFEQPCALCKEICSKERQKDGSAILTIARMEDAKVFSYGLSGQYEFDENLPLKKDDVVCLSCMKAHRFEEHRGIECMVCHEKFQNDVCGAGFGCAGHVRDRTIEGRVVREISCGYGSRYDMSNFQFIAANHLKLEDLVCDPCIYAMHKAGEVAVDTSFWDDMYGDLPKGCRPEDLSVPIKIANPMTFKEQ